MRDHPWQSLSTSKLQGETSPRPKISSEPASPIVRTREAGAKGAVDANHPIRALVHPVPLSEEQQKVFVVLKQIIEMYNRTVPELRIKLPTVFISVVPYLSLNLQICVDYYFKCARLRFNEDAANKIAACLTTFLEQHPLEWRVCSWKNDFITEIALGELECSGDRKKAAEHWLNWYWKRQRKQSRETDLYLSPKRMAASSAVLELESLPLRDKYPELFISPGVRGYKTFIRWLNKNWVALAAKKKGPALLQEAVAKFREKRGDLSFTDSDLVGICEAYKTVEPRYGPGNVPAYQVVVERVARKHGVSARLVTKVRAEENERRKSHDGQEKALS
jgi:hypothetical protein